MSTRPIFFQEGEKPVRRRGFIARWVPRLLIVVIAVILAVMVAEAGTRLIWGRSVVLFPRFHTDATYGRYHLRRLEPSRTFRHTSADGSWVFTTNAQGFRDVQNYSYDKPTGVKRVLCLGDSQTEGFEARQDRIFPAIVEKRLQRLGRNVEVLNTGISGFGTAEELAFFENEGIRYQPDVVVLGWYMDDFDDNEKCGLFSLKEGSLRPDKFEHLPGVDALQTVNSIPPLRWASEHSYFYSALFNGVWEARKQILSQQQSPTTHDENTTRVPHHGARISPYQMELAAALVARLEAVCHAKGIKLLVLDIPWLPEDNSGFGSSMPQEFSDAVEQHADKVLRAEDVLGRYNGVTDIFVSRGQHHISEMSHLILGMAAAEQIATWWTEAPPQP